MKQNKRPIGSVLVEAAAISLFCTDYDACWLCGWNEVSDETRELYRIRAKAALVAARTAEVGG